MSTQTEITRITTDRNTIRTKMVALGLGTATDNLDDLASEVNSIVNRGAVDAEVKEGETYTVPAGYHNGSGTVKGVAGGGNYNLQAKSGIVPTKSLQSITPDSGYYGLSSVAISAIPDAYQDVSSVTAAAADVLVTKTFVPAGGTLTAGTMANNGAVTRTLDTETTSTTIPVGYHNGEGTVSIALETKSVTPTKAAQNITPTSGKVLSQVTVNAIPDAFIDTSDATIQASEVLDGEIAYGYNSTTNKAVQIEGTMPNNGALGTTTLDTTTTTYSVPAGYASSGTVNISLEEKTTTPTTSVQNIAPSTGKVLSKVTVNAIPDKFADTSDADAVSANLLSGKIAYSYDNDNAEAVKITGTMPNNGAQSGTLDTTTTSKAIPAGYTTGGTVSITLEEKSATPTESAQNITPTSGKVLSKVTVNAIPSNYKDTTGTDAIAANILSGKKAVNTTGTITGSMTNNGTVTISLTGLGAVSGDTSYTLAAGYYAGGSVSITNDIETALAAI